MAEENLGRVLEKLSKAMRLMCTNTENLRGRWKAATETGLDGTWEGHLPEGELKERFKKLKPAFAQVPETEKKAKNLIETLIEFHDFVEMEFYRRHPIQ